MFVTSQFPFLAPKFIVIEGPGVVPGPSLPGIDRAGLSGKGKERETGRGKETMKRKGKGSGSAFGKGMSEAVTAEMTDLARKVKRRARSHRKGSR